MKERFGLYLILTDPFAGYEACAEAAVQCGVRYLQLRMKNTARSAIIETALNIRTITRGTPTRLMINDDLSVAMEVDADGLHLGQTDLPLARARDIWNTPGKIYGLSTHTTDQAAEAVALSPDYIGIGPVFPTQTKTDADPVLGAETAGRIAQSVPVTAVAIGGIKADNLPELLQAGVDNYCVVSAVNNADDPADAIRTLQDIWKEHAF